MIRPGICRSFSAPDGPECEPKIFLLCSPTYLIAVAALLVNDFFLKQHYPGWITGKISDFAGLFALSTFLLVISRTPGTLWGLALSFSVWKSPLSQPLIDSWNAVTGFTIGRTVDLTDLAALIVLPIAWFGTAAARSIQVRRQWCWLSCFISLFGFTATSRMPTPEEKAAFHAAVAEFDFPESQPTYRLPHTRRELYRRLEQLGLAVNEREEALPGKRTAFIVPKRFPNLKKASASVPELLWAAVDVDERSNDVVLHLTNISVKRNDRPTNRSIAIRLFEARIVEPLRER